MREMCRLLILCLVLFTTNCAASNQCSIHTYHDEFDSYTITYMLNNSLGKDGPDLSIYSSSSVLDLNAQKLVSKEGHVSYSLIIECVSQLENGSWIFITSGESLAFLIDGKRVGLTGNGSGNDRDLFHSGTIMERAEYPVSREMIRTISNAKEVKVRLIGSKGFIERYFVQANFNNFKKVC